MRNGRCVHRPYRIGFAAFGADFYERVQGFVESALMSGLIAQEESEFGDINPRFGEGLVLKADGALREPPGLGHLLHQERFCFGSGGVLGREIGEERLEAGGIFAWDDDAAGGESECKCVEGMAKI